MDGIMDRRHAGVRCYPITDELFIAEVRAVLDCTSGWAVDTTWRGVSLARVLDGAAVAETARRVEVRSVTGWATSFELADAHDALLAWSVGGGAHAEGEHMDLSKQAMQAKRAAALIYKLTASK